MGVLKSLLLQLDLALRESEQALQMRPSKRDKRTAGNYHSCFRELHWALEQCQRLQQAATMLEAYDASRLTTQSVACSYATLSVEIVTRHDRAQQLLWALCGPEEEEEEAEISETSENFSQWLIG